MRTFIVRFLSNSSNGMLPKRWLTIPNVISMARLALVPVFICEWALDHSIRALGVFVVAMGTDWVDGILARRLNQRSRLGGIIDPMADKLMVLSAVIGLVGRKEFPLWVLVLLMSREIMMLGGALAVQKKGLSTMPRPTRVGKYATLMLTLTVTASLLHIALNILWLEVYIPALGLVAALCIFVSHLQYALMFRKLLKG